MFFVFNVTKIRNLLKTKKHELKFIARLTLFNIEDQAFIG